MGETTVDKLLDGMRTNVRTEQKEANERYMKPMESVSTTREYNVTDQYTDQYNINKYTGSVNEFYEAHDNYLNAARGLKGDEPYARRVEWMLGRDKLEDTVENKPFVDEVEHHCKWLNEKLLGYVDRKANKKILMYAKKARDVASYEVKRSRLRIRGGYYSRIRLKCDRHCGVRKNNPGNWVAEVWDELTCDDQDEEPQKQARTVEKSRDTGTSLKPSDHIDSQQQTRSGVSGKDFMLQFALARLGSKQ